MNKENLPAPKEEALMEAIQKLISDANQATDPKDRKNTLDLVEKLYCVENDKAKVELAEKGCSLTRKSWLRMM